jgi:hypothetical protein
MQMKALSDYPLARKIAIVTAIKVIVLLAIWWLFFNGADRSLTPEQVSNAILHPTSNSLNTP